MARLSPYSATILNELSRGKPNSLAHLHIRRIRTRTRRDGVALHVIEDKCHQ